MKVAPKNIHVLIPGNWEYVRLHGYYGLNCVPLQTLIFKSSLQCDCIWEYDL
jgi:hypothetical protein